jgi:hypothetical protein
MRSALAALVVLAGLSCAETPPAAPQDDARYWVEVCAAHGYSQVETAMATGREAPEVALLQSRIRPPVKPADRLLLLPYPGGRHPRIGFLEGAVDPQRDTKCSVFLPWAGGGYVVIDVPEALWCDKDLVYLAHTHLPTTWDKQGIRLERIDWTRGDGGTLTSRRILPDGLEFSVRVDPAPDGARMELRVKNGTSRRLTKLRAQVCVMLKGAPGFNAQTRENKVKLDASGVCAVRSEDGRRWIATVFEKPRLWENPPCPCIHADPSFPDLAPGDEAVSRGRLFVYEGDDFEAEVARRVRAGRLIAP